MLPAAEPVHGAFFHSLKESQRYNTTEIARIESATRALLSEITTDERPGMLLGKIQSGKTRLFLGILAMSLDSGFQVAVLLTKGTVALAQQTTVRVADAFHSFLADDALQLFDVMRVPDNLTEYELSQPLIMVCKKEDDNLRRLSNLIFKLYPGLSSKRVLIIDDEADLASVGFHRTRQEEIQMNVIARQINDLRHRLTSCSFLQVTATPYSLYLQPANIEIQNVGSPVEPIRPAFTILVPVHDKYVGGDLYFEQSQQEGSVASYMYEPVSTTEFDALQKDDGRRLQLSQVLTSSKIPALRRALTNFVVGVSIRHIQDERLSHRPSKYSIIVHTERARAAHSWQDRVVRALVDELKEALTSDRVILETLIDDAYENLRRSILAGNGYVPPLEEVRQKVQTLLPSVMVARVNSDRDASELLDELGQLKLRTPLNIFIGGQILDRGLTIRNLVGFYYGRRPRQIQQDTVLQHSRMYGTRPEADLLVTRFYTSPDIYQAMQSIHEFDETLRRAFERGGHERGVVFIRREAGRVIPCSPNKILLSQTTILRPLKRLLPVGFQTGYKSQILPKVERLDVMIAELEALHGGAADAPFMIPVEASREIVELIDQTLVFNEPGYDWEVQGFLASLEYCVKTVPQEADTGKLWCLVRRNRDLVRIRSGGRFQNSPDTPHVEGELAREFAIDHPILMLFRQNGNKSAGWRDCPFWWPVLQCPARMRSVVFAGDAAAKA